MRSGSTFWGMVFIVAGIVFLLNSLGILAVNAWNVFWPLFFIFLGIWIVWGQLSPHAARVTKSASILLDGALRARIRVHHGAGRLTVTGGALGEKIVDGTFGGGLEYRSRRNGDMLDVDMHLEAGAFPGPWNWGPGMTLDWNFALNRDVPLSLEFDMGASDNRLDLTDLKVDDLFVKTGASRNEILLPSNAGRTRVRIEGGAAAVAVQLPSGVAARIRTKGGLAGITVDTNRFPRTGDVYQSADYGTAVNQMEIEAELGAGSLNVR